MTHALDSIIARNTGFRSMDEMVNAGGRYRPSLDMREGWARDVADAYDAVQAARGDDRRAYRYGEPKAKPAAPAKAERQPTPFQKAKAAIAEARKGAAKEARLHPELRRLRWTHWRTPLLWAVDAKGDRLNGDSYHEWDGTWRDIEKLVAANPGTVKVYAHGGLQCAANSDEMYWGSYEVVDWEALVWGDE